MTRIEYSLEIRATPERVFDTALAVDQIAGYPGWNPTFARGLRVIEQTDGVGTTWEFPLEALGATGRAEIVAYDPPRRTQSRAAGGLFAEMISEQRVEPTENGSRLTHSIEYRLRYRPASVFLDAVLIRGRMRGIVRDALQAMKERAEFLDRLAA